jgi:hypothetical protein
VEPISYVMKTNDGLGEQILAVDLIVGRSEGQEMEQSTKPYLTVARDYKSIPVLYHLSIIIQCM